MLVGAWSYASRNLAFDAEGYVWGALYWLFFIVTQLSAKLAFNQARPQTFPAPAPAPPLRSLSPPPPPSRAQRPSPARAAATRFLGLLPLLRPWLPL